MLAKLKTTHIFSASHQQPLYVGERAGGHRSQVDAGSSVRVLGSRPDGKSLVTTRLKSATTWRSMFVVDTANLEF